jgi:hypothetical protein
VNRESHDFKSWEDVNGSRPGGRRRRTCGRPRELATRRCCACTPFRDSATCRSRPSASSRSACGSPTCPPAASPPATITKAYQLLGKVMAAAVDAGYLAQSPCHNVPLPKVEREEMRFLTPTEIVTLAETIRPAYRALVFVGAYGGCASGSSPGCVAAGSICCEERSASPRSSPRSPAGSTSARPRRGRAGGRLAYRASSRANSTRT